MVGPLMTCPLPLMVNSPDVKCIKLPYWATLLLLNVQSAVMLKVVIVAAEVNAEYEAGRPQAAIDVGFVSWAGCA